jgi:uncharacterized protein YgbK (DUF1537 family)
LIKAGTSFVILDPTAVFVTEHRARELRRVVNEAAAQLCAGLDTLILADPAPAVVKITQSLGAAHGLDALGASKAVSAALADVTLALVERVAVRRLVVAGGDTSGTVCRRLGIVGNHVLAEIEPGVPAGRAIGRDLVLVLKSGSFGSPDFLRTAITFLHTLDP